MADPSALDPAISGVLRRPFADQVAFFRGKLGNLVPTARWTDMQRDAHDRGFMVAGAQSADLLSGLAAAVDRAITQGTSIDAFRKDFAALVARSGWSYRGDFNWRTRTIYTTNIATSYNAGRLAQLLDGDFPLWRYVHADSVLHPRPLHVSWNGVTLPPHHVWWLTHYTPNGWGCHCRVVGVRSYDASARYGTVKRDAPNDGIDPKTGAPAGIDAGWDYAPGNTVSDTVRAVAAKTQQWEYTLAKAYMQGVPPGVRDELAMAYRALPSVADDTRRYAQRALDDTAATTLAPYHTLGLATADQVATVQRLLGRNVDGYDFALDPNAPRHIQRVHGDEAVEAPRGQRAVTTADYARLPATINNPDRIWSDGDELLIEKAFGTETLVAVFGVLTKRRMLNLKSLRIYRKAPPRSTS
jgi:hypothetical protein